MHHSRIVVAAGLLFWSAPCRDARALAPSPAVVRQQSGGTLSGQVADAKNGPVRGARVSVAELGRAIITDGSGRFSFAGLPSGRYTLIATTARGGRASTAVQVPTSGDVKLTLIEEQSLPAVIVTVQREPSSVVGSPLPTSELSEAQLSASHSISLAQAVDQLPGVHSLTTGMQIGKPVIRGLSGSRVLVLDNGMRVEDYSWSDEDGPSVDARLAQRVEVIRGPASLMYGSDALGGVVNSIPSDLPIATGPGRNTRLGIEAFAGSNNTEIGSAVRLEGASGKYGWRLFGVGRFAEDLHTPDGKLDNTGYVSVNGEAAGARHGARGTSSLRLSHYGGEFKLLEAGGPPPGVEEEGGGPERKLTDDRLQYAGNQMFGNTRLETRVQLQRHSLAEASDELVAQGGPPDAKVFDLLLNTATADVAVHRSSGPWHTSLGMSGLWQSSDSKGIEAIIPDATTTSGGVFAIAGMDGAKVSLLAGLRGDARHISSDPNEELELIAGSRNNSAVSGDLGAAWHVTPNVSLTANAGRAWRAPTLFELYSNGPRPGEDRFEIGNPNLDPETSLNIDGGIRWQSNRASGEVSVFNDKIDRFIYILPTGDTEENLRVYRYVQDDATLSGAEIAATFRPTDALQLRARHDFVRGTNNALDEPLPLIPAARTVVGADVHGERLGALRSPSFGLEVEHNAEQSRRTDFDFTTDAYTLLHLEAGLSAQMAGREYRLSLRVRNLTDVVYKSYLSRYKEFALDPGRNILIRISTGF